MTDLLNKIKPQKIAVLFLNIIYLKENLSAHQGGYY